MKNFMRKNKRLIALPVALAVAGGTTVFATNVLGVLQGSVKVGDTNVDAEFTTMANDTISLGYGLGLEDAHKPAFTANSAGEVVIPSTITDDGKDYDVIGILQGALDDCGDATTITLSEGITTISEGAFDGCASVTTINLPSTLTYLRGHNPFDECDNLIDIVFNGTEDDWNAKGFASSYGSATINFSDSGSTDEAPADWDKDKWIEVNGIDAQIRMNPTTGAIVEVNSSVTIAEIPETIYGVGVTSISGTAFQNCASLEFVSIPSGVTEIENYTFMNGILTIDSIETDYSGGKSLKQVCLPNTLTKIGDGVFYGAKVDTIYIPSTVTSIGSQALYSSNISTILFGGTLENWTSATSTRTIYNENYTTLKYVEGTEISLSVSGIVGGNITFDVETGMITGADNSITIATIPEYIAGYKVVGIAENAFANCTDLRVVNLYDNIETLGSNAFPNTGINIYFYGTQGEWDSLNYTSTESSYITIGSKEFELDVDSNGYIHTNSANGFGTAINDYRPQSADGSGAINGDDTSLTTNFITRLAALSPYSSINGSEPTDYFTAQLADGAGWGGSCFGVASTIGLVFADYTTLDELTVTTLDTDQDTYYELPTPVDDAHLYNSVMYYQVGQGIISGTYIFRQSDGTANAKPLLDALDKGQAVIFSYGYSTGGHAILALDYKQEDGGSYIVTLFDENSYSGTTDSAHLIDLYISSDYKTYSFTPDTGESNEYNPSETKDILTNDPTLKGTTGHTEASYLRFLTLDDVYKIGPVYDSSGNFITDTSSSSIGYTEDIAADTADTMLINIPMNSDITITIDDQTISYKNGLFSGDMTGIEANPVEKGSASEWLLTVPNSDIIYVENNAPEEKDMNVEVFSNKGTLSVKADGIQKAILDINEGIEVMLADGVNSTEMKNYFKIDDELVSVESIITDDTKLFVDDLTQSINVVSIGDAEISTIKNTLTGVSNHLADNFDITIDSNEMKDFFSGWKGK